jgi:hypothetical protein
VADSARSRPATSAFECVATVEKGLTETGQPFEFISSSTLILDFLEYFAPGHFLVEQAVNQTDHDIGC